MTNDSPLFDTSFQEMTRTRLARSARAPAPLFLEAEKLLRKRADLLKERPPALHLSCFDLQNQNDVRASLQELYDHTPQDGLFLGVLAGENSLHELRFSLNEAEMALSGKTSQRVAPMIEMQNLARLLPEIGFAHPALDLQEISLVYPSIYELMHDLRAMGLTNSLTGRPRRPPPRRLFEKAAETYQNRFPAPEGKGIIASIDLIFLHGWKE